MENADGVTIKDAACPDCHCDLLIPLMKIRVITSFSGNRLQMEWPSRDKGDEVANVACPNCQAVFVLRGGGTVTKSHNKVFQKGGKAKVLKFDKK